MTELSFKSLFFRLYDRKIADGTITFSRLGISKSDFTKICTEENFCFDDETLMRIVAAMQLTEDEKKEFLAAAEKARQ